MAAGMIYIGNAAELACEVRILSRGSIPTARLARILLASWIVNERTGNHEVNDKYMADADMFAPDMSWITGRREERKPSRTKTAGGER